MLSTLTIISIFFQIFTTGISLSGAYSFYKRNLETKKREDVYLSLIFLSFAVFTALTIVSQMTYSLGQSLNLRFIIYRAISVDLVIGSLFTAYFIKEKFNFKENLLVQAYTLACIAEAYLIMISPLNLVENIRDVALEPGAHFLSAVPAEIFWVAVWLLLGVRLLFQARVAKTGGERNVNNIAGIAAILVVASFLFSFFYSKNGEAYWLAVSWILYLCSSLGFLWGNIIRPTDEIAKFPISYFRTRILYKLVLLFILLIVILLEATTLATINLNQISLKKAINNNYTGIARSISDRIAFMAASSSGVNKDVVRDIVAVETSGKRFVYVVSPGGKLYVGPDPKEEGRDLSDLKVVKNVMSGQAGSDEYLSDFYVSVADKLVIGAYAPVKKFGLGVIVEEPKWELYSEIRLVSTNTLIFVIVGIFLTVSVGVLFAKSIESSINEVISGTEAVRKGDLSYRIKISSIDEIGQLADAFNQMTKELKQSQDHLLSSEKLASLGTMAAGMAHEIKNPLVSLRTFTQLLPQRFDDKEFRDKFATVVPQEIDKINKIAESLLRFGRPHKPELSDVNINEIIEEILALFDNEARKNNIRVTTKLAELPKITADAGQLSQAFVNVILNAIQAMPGGGELTIKTDVGEIVRLSPSAKAAEGEEEAKPVPVVFVEITDTGSGIPDENLKKIFDPFFTTKEVGGTGMGLPITLRIIEEHQGSIRVKSQIGKGTTFLITLPRAHEVKA